MSLWLLLKKEKAELQIDGEKQRAFRKFPFSPAGLIKKGKRKGRGGGDRRGGASELDVKSTELSTAELHGKTVRLKKGSERNKASGRRNFAVSFDAALSLW